MERRLLVFVPAVAALVTAFAFFGPARARPIVSARVFAGPDGNGTLRSLRIQTVERVQGIDEPRPVPDLSLRIDGNEVWKDSSPSDAVTEIALGERAVGAVNLSLVMGESVLAHGRIQALTEDPPLARTSLAGAHEGRVEVSVEAPRGQLIPPFVERVRVVATHDGKPVTGVAHVVTTGAVTARDSAGLDGQGTAWIEIEPQAQSADIEVSVDAEDGSSGSFKGALPIGVGSIWLSDQSTPSHLEVAVRSPHRAAYLSLYDEVGRFDGRVVRLEAGADGLYRGAVDLPPPTKSYLAVVVATDPNERGLTTTSWPVEPPVLRRAYDPLVKVLDGSTEVEAMERARVSRARRIIALFLGGATLLEIALLILEWRKTRKELRRHFDASSVGDEGEAEGATGVDTSKLVSAGSNTAVVAGAVAAILILAGATLAALDFTAGGF